MLENANVAVSFVGWFTATKVGKAGLVDVVVDVYRVSSHSKILSDQAATEVGGGIYEYTMAGQATASEYVAVFKTADATVDAQHTPSLWSIGRNWLNASNVVTVG